jgi:hypothetical protein
MGGLEIPLKGLVLSGPGVWEGDTTLDFTHTITLDQIHMNEM